MLVSFFHLHWMINRKRWKTILIIKKNYFETPAWWVNKKIPFVALYSKPIDLVNPAMLLQNKQKQ